MAGRKGRGEPGQWRGEGRRDVSVLEVVRTRPCPGLRLNCRQGEAERPRKSKDKEKHRHRERGEGEGRREKSSRASIGIQCRRDKTMPRTVTHTPRPQNPTATGSLIILSFTFPKLANKSRSNQITFFR